jgi:hypothetical protein
MGDGIGIDLRENVWGLWSGFSWPRIEQVAGSYEHGDELSGSGSTKLVISA